MICYHIASGITGLRKWTLVVICHMMSYDRIRHLPWHIHNMVMSFSWHRVDVKCHLLLSCVSYDIWPLMAEGSSEVFPVNLLCCLCWISDPCVMWCFLLLWCFFSYLGSTHAGDPRGPSSPGSPSSSPQTPMGLCSSSSENAANGGCSGAFCHSAGGWR